jgi:hypothetical protein
MGVSPCRSIELISSAPMVTFFNFKPLICGSDDEALAEAKQLVDGHAVELWSGERFITKLEHNSE